MTTFFSAGPAAFAVEARAALDLFRYLSKHGQNDVTLVADRQDGAKWLGVASPADLGGGNGTLTIFTSGTTGPPKLIRRDIVRLFSQPSRGNADDRWVLCYSPLRWAGLSVITHTINAGCELVVPDSMGPLDIISAMRKATHASLTPSLFRKLVATDADALCAAPFKQITFGGEWTNQQTLSLCREIFPDARITHIYASTELGDVCAISDGKAGFPRYKFGAHELLADGELVIGGYHTGDLWHETDGRLHFVGRATDQISVGGVLVGAAMVEDAALSHPEVSQAQAFAVPNPLLGHVVGLRYAGTAATDDLRVHMSKLLPKVAVPLKFDKKADLDLTESGKLARPIIASDTK